MKNCLFKIYSNLVLLFAFFGASAQKMPEIQSVSLFSTIKIKVDGKIDDWGDRLQAYNKAVELSYAIKNDDEDLYLFIQATNPRVIEKIMNTGVAFIINTDNKKDLNDINNISITYPNNIVRYAHGILVNAGTKASWSGIPNKRSFPETLTRTDSTVSIANKTLISYAQNIKVKGVSKLLDSSLSIYNEQHIRVAGLFDIKGVYSYEMAIPLKYFNLKSQRFSYSIFLKGFDTGNTFRPRDPVTGKLAEQALDADPDLEADTHFWGDYTIAKMP